jgi:glutathione peroxidase
MKSLAALLMLTLISLPMASHAAQACPDLLNHEFRQLPSGKSENLCQHQGKVVLVVNTASRCGFTPQFEGLQKLHEQYKSRGLVVLGFPSNDFNQEPDQGKQISNFCKLNYGVDFPMFEKTRVSGDQANAFYKSLAKASGSAPRWNFHKYLIARDGKTVIPLESRVEPDGREMRTKIESMLEQRS